MVHANRVTVVVLTHCRVDEVVRTVQCLLDLPERPPIIVVDNGSTDGTVTVLRQRFPHIQVLALKTNIGAAARNVGIQAARTPYIALCDDDTVWAPGALTQAVDVLERYPYIAIVTGRVLVGPDEQEDPICRVMAESPLTFDRELPGPSLIGFLAGASMVRRSAVLAANGFEPKLFLGGEEALLSLDLLAMGWAIVYMDSVLVSHYPSPRRDSRARRLLLMRNALWVSWLRRPMISVVRETLCLSYRAVHDGDALSALLQALRGIFWTMWHRRRIPEYVESSLRQLEQPHRIQLRRRLMDKALHSSVTVDETAT